MRLGVGFKLGIWLALFGILSTALTGYYAYSKSRELLIAAAEDKLLTATDVLGQRFLDSLIPITEDLSMIVSLPALTALADGVAGADLEKRHHAKLEEVFASMLKSRVDYVQLRVIGVADFGRELIRTDRTGNGIEAVNNDDLQEKGHFPYLFEAVKMRAGEFYFSKINLNRERHWQDGFDTPTLRIATQVRGADGKVFGIVIVNVDLNRLFSRLRSNLPRNIDLVLTNDEGDYLIHPDQRKTFGFDRGRRILIQDDIADIKSLLEPGPVGHLLTRSNMGSKEVANAGAFVRVPFGSASQPYFVLLGLQTPLGLVLRDSELLGVTIIQITVLCSLAAACLSFLLSFVLAKPLNAMATAVKQFEVGKVIVSLPTERDDEIGYLARSFQLMSNRLSSQVSDLQEREHHLQHLAHHDQLTGLPNRAMFQQALDAMINKASVEDSRFCLMFIDLDKFKQINDQLGHVVGDQALQLAALRMRASVRNEDIVARLGGDEFTILVSDFRHESDVTAMALKLIHVFDQTFVVDGHEFDMTCSIGISMFPQDGKDADQLLNAADAAMYRAKLGKRSMLEWFSDLSGNAT
ncbi:diguanylate cyclase domain-containing protein [Actimicrobium sp. CCI2.3]|uniref:sensor domain-containing diguanylate cyclase n=1 Tax=Actimicrobium sp. CCI2.3 TaxID=3048616 RepID=UPI002AB5557B|nr:diguanylate cyclase [Actimicrobium sp. CCI2.3]MDY7572917.1 diguanylate cyclase [Actimicrobium sp. CCI2.3]MEB0020762.1 diguanylate cyclase [Actimicrobium sp. CCI2.3]